jgi:enterochelin esterase-like enzyme
MKALILSLILMVMFPIAYCQSFQSFVDHVNALTDSSDKVAAVDSFMTANDTLPYIIGDTATFVYRGNATSVGLPADWNKWGIMIDYLNLLPGTDLWYLSLSFELDARLDYDFLINGMDQINDPKNPLTQAYSATDYHSVLAMPEYVWPWETESYPAVPEGTLEPFTISSNITGRTYNITVYLPPDYQANPSNTYPAVYFNDGPTYLYVAPGILDNLIDSNLIPPVIGVFAEHFDREDDYYGPDRNIYRQYFVNELVPYIDSVYRTIPTPENRAVIGLSASGNIGALIGYHHPDVFGKVGLHSAAFIYNNWETYNLFISAPYKEIQWAAVWGSYDVPWLTSNMRDFRDNLIAKGYDFEGTEYHEGHSFGLWAGTVDDLLIPFFGGSVGGIKPAGRQGIPFSVFPNPSSGPATVRFELPKTGSVSVEIADREGRRTGILHSAVLPAGEHELAVNPEGLSSGMYFLILESGGQVSVRKWWVR